MNIELKDIIKPKFAIGQTVYIRRRDSNSVSKAEVNEWEMTIRSKGNASFTYLMRYGSTWFDESELYTSAEEAFSGVSVK